MAKSSSTQAEDAKASEALELVKDLRDTFQERNDLYAYTDRVLYMDEPVYIPEKYKDSTVEVRQPLALHAVNTIAAALSKNAPKTQFDPVSIGETGIANSTKREHFLDASWEQQQREARRRIFRAFIHSLVGKGEGILKTQERRKESWAQYDRKLPDLKKEVDAKHGDNYDARDKEYDQRTEELKRGLSYPIMTEDIPPENFYYIKGSRGFSCCVEVKSVPYYETLARYKDFGLSSSGKIVAAAAGLPESGWGEVMRKRKTRNLTMAEVWTCSDVKYLLLGPGDSLDKRSGKLVHTVAHGYGDEDTQSLRGPYFHSYGISTSSRNVATMGISVIFGYLRLYGALNSLLTMEMQAAFRYAFTAYKRKQQPGYGLPDNVMSLSPAPGSDGQQITNVAPGDIIPWDIDPIELGHAGVDLDKGIAMIRQLVDLALPEVVQGVMADSSGYAVAQAAHLARLVWDPIVDNAEICLSEQAGFESWLIENMIKEPVYVFGDLPNTGRKSPARGVFSLGPADTAGVHRYHRRLEPDTPSNEVIKLRAIIEAMGARIMSPQQAIVERGGNVDEVEHDWLIWDLKQDPRVKAKIMDRTLAKLDVADQELYGAAVAQYGGQPPGAALGGMGQVMQPGQTMPIQPPPPGIGGPGPGSIGPTPVQPNPAGPVGGE